MKHRELIRQMTLEEKASLMSGRGFWDTVAVERLGIPSVVLSDGPHGIRRQAGETDHLGLNKSLPATCFPTAAAMANSWNPELGEAVGRLLGEEARSQGVHVVLGPGLNIKRSPLCGRNFEYFSEDPWLSGKMAAGYIRGIQSQGTAACPKHFAANNQELRRMSGDSVMDQRTLREMYLTGFEIAVKEGKPDCMMSAYNRINGVYANENEMLLDQILRKEWGFQGIVVSDWGGSNDHGAGVRAGSNLEMPGTGEDGKRLLLEAVRSKELDEAVLEQRVDELLDVILPLAERSQEPKEAFDAEAHHQAAKRAAEECMVLLKNEDGLLPLKKGKTLAVIGDFAFHARYQGAGSSLVNATRVTEAIEVWQGEDVSLVGCCPGFLRNGEESASLKAEAVDMAKEADIVLMYLGLDEQSEAEGKDREHMRLPENQIALLNAVVRVNPDVAVVLSAGCAVEMPWISDVKALIHGYLPGQAGAEAAAELLTGRVCPSGRLAETYPMHLEDTPCYLYYPGKEKTSEYREGLYVGYRYYESAGIPVRFPFGYGLSYTAFSYDSLEIRDGKAIVTITNTGAMTGGEVVQMYIAFPGGKIFRPAKELKGFQKIFLEPGESGTVTLPLEERCFRYFNEQTGTWEEEKGTYDILIGANVQNIRLTAQVQRDGTGTPVFTRQEELPSYYSGQIQEVSDREFEMLLGHEIPESRWQRDQPLTINDAVSQMEYAKSGAARLTLRLMTALIHRSLKKGKPNLNLLFIYNIPFRGIAKMMGGAVTMEMAEGLLVMVNGQFFKGASQLIRGAYRNRRKTRGDRK